MSIAAEYYLPFEVSYRRERIAGDWRSANGRRPVRDRRRFLRLPKRPTRRLLKRRPGVVAVA